MFWFYWYTSEEKARLISTVSVSQGHFCSHQCLPMAHQLLVDFVAVHRSLFCHPHGTYRHVQAQHRKLFYLFINQSTSRKHWNLRKQTSVTDRRKFSEQIGDFWAALSTRQVFRQHVVLYIQIYIAPKWWIKGIWGTASVSYQYSVIITAPSLARQATPSLLETNWSKNETLGLLVSDHFTNNQEWNVRPTCSWLFHKQSRDDYL